MAEIDARDFGRLEAEVESLRVAVTGQEKKIDELLALANQGRGAWWAGLTIASGIGALAGFVSHLFFKS
jgi:hypothetical protein